jgi:putative PEP-CTERM system TPR-repeat lipoprotein
MRLAGVHMLMKNETAAAADIKRALDLAPDFMPARAAQIELAMRANHPDEALNITHEMQKQNPKSPMGFAAEGDVLMAQQKPALAAAAYDKALTLAKTGPIMLKSLMAMNAAGKSKEAQARAQQWIKEDPKDQAITNFAAESSLANNDFKTAIGLFEKLLKNNPDNAVILNNLAWAYQQEKDPRALETAEKAFKLAGDNPGIMDTLGWMLVEQGNTERGLPLLQKAGSLAPDAPEVHYHLAVGLSKSGDKQGARKELEKLQAQNNPFPQIPEALTMLKTQKVPDPSRHMSL